MVVLRYTMQTFKNSDLKRYLLIDCICIDLKYDNSYFWLVELWFILIFSCMLFCPFLNLLCCDEHITFKKTNNKPKQKDIENTFGNSSKKG